MCSFRSLWCHKYTLFTARIGNKKLIFHHISYCPWDCRCHGHLGSRSFIPSCNIPVNRTVPLVSSSPLEMSWFVRFVESQLGKCWHGTARRPQFGVKLYRSELTVDWDTYHVHLSWESCHCFEIFWEHDTSAIILRIHSCTDPMEHLQHGWYHVTRNSGARFSKPWCAPTAWTLAVFAWL